MVILAACQNTGASIPTPTVPPSWQDFHSSEGGFSAEFPAAPESQVWTGRDDNFGQVYRGVFTSTYQNMTYRVYYMVVSGGLEQFGTPDQTLVMVRDGAAKNYKAKVLGSKPGNLGNYAGLEYSLDAPDSKALPGGGVIQSRVYLINDRIYAIEHIGPKKNSLLPDIKKFMDSFQVSGVANLPTPVPVADSDVTAPEGWQDFVAQKDGFSVLLPDTPKREVTSNDKTTEVVSYLAYAGLDGYSVLSFNFKDPELAKAPPEVLLGVVKESILSGQQAVVLSETPIQLGPYAGYELLIKQPQSKELPAEGRILMRLYLVDARLYVVMAITLGKDTPPEVAPFLDSFKVLDSK
jgi:hypothetical protein